MINYLKFSSPSLEMCVQIPTHSMDVARELHNRATFQKAIQSKARVLLAVSTLLNSFFSFHFFSVSPPTPLPSLLSELSQIFKHWLWY